MLTQQDNELVTHTGSETAAGKVLRQYWQPAALTEELSAERPLIPVRLLGEDLVLFRNEHNEYGLLARQCSHRGTDLCYGRLEDGGLRCPYHGWLYGVDGRCREQPAEPESSRFREKINHTAYPCIAHNGIVFAYLGPGQPPLLPDWDCFSAPDIHTFAFKGHIDCNWLQALEGGIDPAHVSFLHRFSVDDDPDEGYGQQFRDQAAETRIPVTKILRDHPRPQIEVERTAYGLRIFALRKLSEQNLHLRVTNLAFPNAIVIPMSNDMLITQWHMPIDDKQSWWYAIFSSFKQPVNKQTMREQRLQLYTVPDYRPRRNRSNNYGYDAKEQRELTYTGMGMDINVHDNWAVESAGYIQDRSKEHLGASDKAITAYRRLLLRAIKGDQVLSGDEKQPIAIDTIAATTDWQQQWQQQDQQRRQHSPWART